MAPELWRHILEKIDFAFQPIIHAANGKVFGYEALIRHTDRAGFATIDAFFDRAYAEGVLYEIDLVLRRMAITKFLTLRKPGEKLFYNVDSRILEMPDYQPGNTRELLADLALESESLYYELSEKYHFRSYANLKTILMMYKRQGYKLALDDFGAGYAGLELLYHADVDLLKIDRFLISSLQTDSKKRLFMGHIIKLAHAQGLRVVAEGVETAEEFYTCRDLGADLIQGYFIRRPSLRREEISAPLPDDLVQMIVSEKRSGRKDSALIEEKLEMLPPLPIDAKISSIVNKFRNDERVSIYPVVNAAGVPAGLITEKSLKKYFYSAYGKDLIHNRPIGKYVSPCPVVEITTPIETILDTFADSAETANGIIVTNEGKYFGFLSPQSLLSIVNEKNLRTAREQNPLTKLPGNILIGEYIGHVFEDTANGYVLAYFDLDNFKPFNDKFGFRQGDRAILLLADLLTEQIRPVKGFVGHVGGDDFFAGMATSQGRDDAINRIAAVLDDFAQTARTFYDAAEKERGFIVAKDRFGVEKEFPLLTVSAACVIIPPGERETGAEALSGALAELKKEAKASADRLASLVLSRSASVF